LSSDLYTRMRPLYSIKPSLRKRSGVTVTAGAAIASATTVVEGITAVAGVRPIVDLRPAHQKYTQAIRESPTLNLPRVVPIPQHRMVAHHTQRQRIVARPTPHPTRQQRIVAHPMLHPTQRLRIIVAANLTAAVDLMLRADPMMVVGTKIS